MLERWRQKKVSVHLKLYRPFAATLVPDSFCRALANIVPPRVLW